MIEYGYTHFVGPEATKLKKRARTCAKGDYQINLLFGGEAWSGSTIKGTAKSWGASYYRSRIALLQRIEAAGIPHRFETINRRKVLVIGDDTCKPS